MSERISFELEPADTLRLANLCGQFDEHLKQIESRLSVDIFCRGNRYTVQGENRPVQAARHLLYSLYHTRADQSPSAGVRISGTGGSASSA